MANLNSAAEKWARKTADAAGRWQANTQQYGAANYCKGMSEFLGGSAGSLCSRYQQGIAATSAGAYQQGVSGKAQKYIEGMRRAAGL